MHDSAFSFNKSLRRIPQSIMSTALFIKLRGPFVDYCFRCWWLVPFVVPWNLETCWSLASWLSESYQLVAKSMGAFRHIIKSLQHQLLLTALTSLKSRLDQSLLSSQLHRETQWCLICILVTLPPDLNTKIRTLLFSLSLSSLHIFNNNTTGKIMNLFS